MKSGLWTVIVVVASVVGFLVGYSVSGFSGARQVRLADAKAGSAGGYAAETAHGASAAGNPSGAGDASAPPAAQAPSRGHGAARPAAGY